MKKNIISNIDEEFAKSKLKKFYDKGLIPPDKKEYLTDHKRSFGPYMAIKNEKNTSYMFDASSQIATLGLGFNPTTFFGVPHFAESWSHRTDTRVFKSVRNAFEKFLQRKLNSKKVDIHFCHSGAEANEIALGKAWSKRVHPHARQVLAFEGSFHGRMQVSLCSTWNKSKREPFEREDYQCVFTDYPEIKEGQIRKTIPKDWVKAWEDPENLPTFESLGHNFELEVKCLTKVKEHIKTGHIFAVIIEPMQCEGGDRYASNRFHLALRALTKFYQIPLIYDEVQTGFHLGEEFFWHRLFDLKDSRGESDFPDYVVCAKRAQVGIVADFSKSQDKNREEEFSAASLIRGYYHGLMLDQQQEEIQNLGRQVKKKLDAYVNKFSENILMPRYQGTAFSFDFEDSTQIAEFIKRRFKYGMLYYPAGTHTLRFRLGTSCEQEDLDFLFYGLVAIGEEVFFGKTDKAPIEAYEMKHRNVETNYNVHTVLVKLQNDLLHNRSINHEDIYQELKKCFHFEDFDLHKISQQNYPRFREKIAELQKIVYEPTRQTDVELFDRMVNDENSLSFVLTKGDDLAGMVFGSPLKYNSSERGVTNDENLNDLNSLYMLDVTINPKFSGSGLGKFLKYLYYFEALIRGDKRLIGRNRDRIAKKMLGINISLGAYETQYLKDDYQDDLKYRDALFYTTNLAWERSSLNLTCGLSSLRDLDSLTNEKIDEGMPKIMNKVCLSNFVNEDYLDHFDVILEKVPFNLRQGYSSSGQSECVDKICKSFYSKRKPKSRLVSFKECHFGAGSFYSRSLSDGEDTFFECSHLDFPTEENYTSVLQEVELALTDALAVFIEPLTQKTLKRAPLKFLEALKELCRNNDVPLVFNETASKFYYYDKDYFCASNVIEPDAGFMYLGGQSAIVFINKEYFVDTPLMMISTWDGDEFSLWTAVEALRIIENDKEEFNRIKERFTQKFNELNPNANLVNAIGLCGTDKIYPNLDMMLRYLNG